MTRIFVHVTSGPADPTKAALAFLVAATAAKDGHEVSLFVAGDGVSLFGPDVVNTLEGRGTGRLRDHLDALREHTVPIFLSGMSAKARDLDASVLSPWGAEFAMPSKLVELAIKSETTLCY
jgi:uncharacterized protein